jgi:tight adherence protein B
MGIAIFVFLVSVLLILGVYGAVTFMPGYFEQRKMAERLKDVSMPVDLNPREGASVVVQKDVGPLPAFDRAVEQLAAGKGIARLIEQSGTKTTPSGLIVMSIVCGIAGAIIAAVASRYILATIPAALIGLIAPFAWLVHRRSSRMKKFEEQFPEALDLLSRAIRAGHALQTALGMAADELAEPVGPEFKKVFEQQNFGLPLREALDGLAVRVPNLDVRFFVTAVMIQRDTGGNLSEILDNLAHVVRERFKIRRQIRVHTAHGRFTAWVLLALPAALAAALMMINPDHMQLLFRERIGQLMLVGTLVLQTIGYFWIRQVIKIEV